MQIVLKWNEGMAFEAEVEGHTLRIDAKAPLGKDSGPTPKELVAIGLGGCTAMDVIALLKKFRQPPTTFQVFVELAKSKGRQPEVFEHALITFAVTGNVEAEKLVEAVRRSQTQYCGVSAMLAKAFPIAYQIELNGKTVGTGRAEFAEQSQEEGK